VSAVAFLGIAVAVGVFGSLVVAFRNRSSRTHEDGVEHFSAVMRALAPQDSPPTEQRKR
jgi:hypothetical protein